jgi:hypothetical protein
VGPPATSPAARPPPRAARRAPTPAPSPPLAPLSGIKFDAASFLSDGTNTNTWSKLGPGTDACKEGGTCTAGKLIACRQFDTSFAAYVNSFGGALTRPAWDVGTCNDGVRARALGGPAGEGAGAGAAARSCLPPLSSAAEPA